MSGVKGQKGTKPERPSLETLPKDTSLAELDGRRAFARARKARLAGYIADLGGSVSVAQLSLLERAVSIESWCVTFERALAEGTAGGADQEKLQTYLKAVHTLLSIAKSLGLRRVAKDAPEDLNAYVQEKYGSGKASLKKA